MPTSGIRRINAGKNHYYKLDGERADGVTTLIGKGTPKPALPYWAAKVVAEKVADAHEDYLWALRQEGRDAMVNQLKRAPWEQRDAAAVRGTEVHGFAEKLVSGEPVDVPDPLAGLVEQCAHFLDDWGVEPVLMERVVASRQWMYAGTFDLIADVRDGRRVLFDYKTAASGVWGETALQLAAYRNAETYLGTDDVTEVPVREIGIEQCMAVWVRHDEYQVLPVESGEEVFRTFLHVAHVARQMDRMRAWIGAPQAAPKEIES